MFALMENIWETARGSHPTGKGQSRWLAGENAL